MVVPCLIGTDRTHVDEDCALLHRIGSALRKQHISNGCTIRQHRDHELRPRDSLDRIVTDRNAGGG